ncbi:translation initiation factor IF-2 N-terminal domain-containing protein, partial [Myxococcota bacterium]|nr:translation initiation factor IF-2 N-terminal domain-containing protein [Myxococcota bacterium]
MATIRAYKLAEELGIDRHEFVDKAAAVGVEVKSAMASLDDDQVSLLRDKLGRGEESGRRMEERRVEGKRGTTVLRRRKRAQPDPEPAPASLALDQPIDGDPVGAVEETSGDARPIEPPDLPVEEDPEPEPEIV